ncbi:hypothetical protein ACFLXY_11060 [Chloroflexota bacterium]
MEGIFGILQGLGFFVVLPVLVGLIIISLSMIFQQLKTKMAGNIKESIDNLVCSIDADCPTGYICMDGQCIPQNN